MPNVDLFCRRASRWGVLAGILALAACADADQTPAQAPDTVIARFVPGGEVTVIEVSVSDRRPLRSAELVGPNGAVVPAYSIEAQRPDVYAEPPYRPSGAVGFGVGSAFGSGSSVFGSGVGATVPLTPPPTAGSETFTTGQILSTALLRLTEPSSYRRDWRLWKVRVQIGDPPDLSLVTLAAPQPPPNL